MVPPGPGADTHGGYETLLIRDPQRRVRARLRLPLHARGPEIRTIPLPLEWSARTGFRYHEVQGLLALQSALVAGGRVMTPRDLVLRLERALQEMLPVGAAAFTPLEMPPDEDWPSPRATNGLPVPPDELDSLSKRRDRILLLPDLGRDGSLLALGLGDEETGWRGLLVLRHADREHFTRERLALAQLVAHHFQCLISTSIRLQVLIFYDVLTRAFPTAPTSSCRSSARSRVADRRGQSLALLLIDVDDFKSFNTRYGYEGGDHVLATVACVLKTTLRNTDTLARYGGEEFAAILSPPVPLEEARMIAERLRAAVADEPLPIRGLDGKTVTERVTVSIGGVLYPSGGRTVSRSLERRQPAPARGQGAREEPGAVRGGSEASVIATGRRGSPSPPSRLPLLDRRPAIRRVPRAGSDASRTPRFVRRRAVTSRCAQDHPGEPVLHLALHGAAQRPGPVLRVVARLRGAAPSPRRVARSRIRRRGQGAVQRARAADRRSAAVRSRESEVKITISSSRFRNSGRKWARRIRCTSRLQRRGSARPRPDRSSRFPGCWS